MPSGFGILSPTGNQTFQVFWGPKNLSIPVRLVTLTWLRAIVTMEYCFLRPGCKSFFSTRSNCEGGKQRHCALNGNNELILLPHYLHMERQLSCSECSDFLKAWLIRKTTNVKWLQLQCEGGISVAVRVQQLQCPMPAGPFAGLPSSHVW